MFKKLAFLLAAVLSTVAVQAKSFEAPVYVTNPPVTVGVLHITPHMPDLSRNAIEIGRNIYDDPYNTVFTTVTLELVQDEKGKVVGNARFQSSRQPTGQPSVSLPLDIPVVGKIKGGSVKLKGKQRIVAGAEGDRKKRNVSINITGELIDFKPADLSGEIQTFDDLQSDATYRFNVKVGGLGFNYDFVSDAVNKGRYLFIYQVLPPDEALGLKFPNGGDLYKVWTPWGTVLAKGYVAVDELQNTILTLKGKKFQYTGIEEGGNGIAPFFPNVMSVKTSYSSVTVAEPELLTLLGFFQVFDGGSI